MIGSRLRPLARPALVPLLALAAAPARQSAPAETVWLESLDLGAMDQEWGEPRAAKSVEGKPLTMRGHVHVHGVGTHARSEMTIDLRGAAERFTAVVGVDDETKGKGSVTFEVWLDGEKRFDSGPMAGSHLPKSVALPMRGAKTCKLVVTDAGDGIDFDHANWASAAFDVAAGRPERPRAVAVGDEPAPAIRPNESTEPRLHAPPAVGASAGKPFLLQLPATGTGPLEFFAAGLPEGLALDRANGRISGAMKQPAVATATLGVRSALGEHRRAIAFFGDGRLARTPPLGWSSWYAWGDRVTDAKVREAADALVATGLAAHGWRAVYIDDGWQGARDASGRIRPNERFPDMKALCDYVHSKGLQIGIYTSPGPKTCAGYEGSWGHEESDARQFAEWGFDALKHDWCSAQGDMRAAYAKMRDALAKQPRDFVYGLCQYGRDAVWEWGASVGGNTWRTTDDITDRWSVVARIGFGHDGRERFVGPGRWNDPDMLMVGSLGTPEGPRPTRLRPNEQVAQVTLWSLLAAPLVISCDLSQLDAFTRALLTNEEVLAVDQDELGRAARRVSRDGDREVWARELADGSLAVGLFNRGPARAEVTARFADLGVSGKRAVRDLWMRKEAGIVEDAYKAEVPAHGAVLVRVAPPG